MVDFDVMLRFALEWVFFPHFYENNKIALRFSLLWRLSHLKKSSLFEVFCFHRTDGSHCLMNTDRCTFVPTFHSPTEITLKCHARTNCLLLLKSKYRVGCVINGTASSFLNSIKSAFFLTYTQVVIFKDKFLKCSSLLSLFLGRNKPIIKLLSSYV